MDSFAWLLDTGRKLNVHKTFNLRHMARGKNVYYQSEAAIQLAMWQRLYLKQFFFVFSYILCWSKALGICAESFCVEADFLREVR